MSGESTLDLGIAGTALEVHGPQTWLDPLRRAWDPWRPRPGTHPWPVEIVVCDTVLAPPNGPLFEIVPRCRGGVCELVGAGFSGHVDAGQQRAMLKAHLEATPADVGYFLRVALAIQGFAYGGMLFHAAGIVHGDRGYALFGVSGSGKTTAARLSAPDPVLNDDLLLLWPEEQRWQIYATPFGKKRGDVGQSPLYALLRLIKAPDVLLETMPAGQALGELMANTPVLSGDTLWLPDVFARWEKLMRQIPVRALHFRKEPTFWEVIDAELG